MIENQSDTFDNKEENVPDEEKVSENSSSVVDKVNDDNQSSPEESVDIDDEELKNTISNNDARLEQLEKEHETLKSQYVRIAADFDNFRKRQSRDQDD